MVKIDIVFSTFFHIVLFMLQFVVHLCYPYKLNIHVLRYLFSYLRIISISPLASGIICQPQIQICQPLRLIKILPSCASLNFTHAVNS